jgi:hypothetical protein
VWNGAVHGKILTRSRERDETDTWTDKERSFLELVKWARASISKRLKKRLTETTILAYFDTNKEVVLQVDSSKNGVGAVLQQDESP